MTLTYPSLLFLEMSTERSPPSQYSMMMYIVVLLRSMILSQQRTMCWCFSSRRRLTSDTNICFSDSVMVPYSISFHTSIYIIKESAYKLKFNTCTMIHELLNMQKQVGNDLFLYIFDMYLDYNYIYRYMYNYNVFLFFLFFFSILVLSLYVNIQPYLR